MIQYTKLQRLTLAPDIITRTRLLDQLEQGSDLPFCLVSAPAGYGKSTLTSQWAAITKTPSCWVTLDDDHNDLHLLLHYLVTTIKECVPSEGFHTEALLEADPLPPPEKLAIYLLNDLYRLPHRIILLLDDYHLITEQKVHHFFTAVLAQVPRNLHLVLVTRKDPPFSIATMRAKGLMTEIRARDLRFLEEEIASFLGAMLEQPLNDETTGLLQQKTEGWAAGIRLAGLYLKGQQNKAELVAGLDGNARYIAEYLFSEIISRLHPGMVSRLMEFSILDRFNASLGDYLHQGSDPGSGGQQCIDLLLQSNIFITPLDNDNEWFRFHHLFQDYLKGMLQKQSGMDEINELHLLAGRWFAQNELIEEAIHHLLAAREYSEATRLVLSQRHGLMNSSQFIRLGQWLAAFPKEFLAREPLLMTTRAFIAADMGNNQDLHAFTEKADKMLEGLAPGAPRYLELKGEVLVLKSLLEVIKNDVKSAYRLVREALDNLPENSLVAKLCGILTLALCHQMTGNRHQAAVVIEEATANLSAHANIESRIQLCLCYISYLDANLYEVERAARRSLQIIQEFPFFHTRAYCGYFLGVALYMQNKLDQAQALLQSTFNDPYSANPTYLANVAFILACIHLCYGREEEAGQVLLQFEEHCRVHDHERAMALISAFKAEFSYRLGDIGKANMNARYIDFDINQPRWFFYVPQLTQIKCLAAQGTKQGLNQAHARLIKLDEQMQQINRVNVRIETLILLSIVYQKLKRSSEARKALQTAVALARPGNWIRSFLDGRQPIKSLLKQLARDGKEQEFVEKIVHAFSLEDVQFSPPVQPFSTTAPQHSQVLEQLTRREKELLPLLAQGLSNKEIADRLSVSDLTIKSHLQNIYSKLGVKGRMEAVSKAGIIQSTG